MQAVSMPLKKKIQHIEDKIERAKDMLRIEKKEVQHVRTKLATFEHVYNALINDVLKEGLESCAELSKEFNSFRKQDQVELQNLSETIRICYQE